MISLQMMKMVIRMVTDKETQLQVLTQTVKKLLNESDIDADTFLKNEFHEAITAKYNAFKYPQMHVVINHQ